MARSASADPFSSNQLWARLVTGALVLTIIMDVVGMLSGIAEVRLVSRIINGEFVTLEEAESNDDRQALVGGIQLAVFGVTALLFLVWIYRAYKNLRAFNVEGLKYSPGWAVGGWFVPILNWWRPYQVMSEIWRGSSPEAVGTNDRTWERIPASPLLGFWWALWIIGGFVGSFLLRSIFSEPEDLEQLRTYSVAVVVGDGIEIPAAILAILVVSQITSRQEEKNHILQARKPLDHRVEGRTEVP